MVLNDSGSLMRGKIWKGVLMQIVYFHQGNAGGIVYTPHDRSVVTLRQVCDNRGFQSVTGCVADGLNVADLVGGDNPTDDRRCPVVIRGNQSSCAIVQFQRRINKHVGNAILRELRPNRANNYPLWLSPLNNEPSDHHIVASLNKAASTDVA